jgi:hypothetical protein
VISLDDKVRGRRRFAERNPSQLPSKGCFYVGSTCLKPEERFAQHRTGKKACRYVRQYGRWLAKKKYEKLPTYSSRQEAELAERALAEQLRRKGYGVWQN